MRAFTLTILYSIWPRRPIRSLLLASAHISIPSVYMHARIPRASPIIDDVITGPVVYYMIYLANDTIDGIIFSNLLIY